MFAASHLIHRFPPQHQLLRGSSKASCHGNHLQQKGILAYPSLKPVHSADQKGRPQQCNPSWSLLPQGLISFPVLIASPQLSSLLTRSGTSKYQINCHLYPHLQLPRTPISKKTIGNQPKGEYTWQHGGGFRYYEISGASTTASEERQERYAVITAKASGKRVNNMQLFLTADLTFLSFEQTGIPQKYTHPSTYDGWHTSVMYK